MHLWSLDDHLLQKLSEVVTNTFTSWPLAHSMTIEECDAPVSSCSELKEKIWALKTWWKTWWYLSGYYDQKVGSNRLNLVDLMLRKAEKNTHAIPRHHATLVIIDPEYYWRDTSVLKNTRPRPSKIARHIFSTDFHLVKPLRTTCVIAENQPLHLIFTQEIHLRGTGVFKDTTCCEKTLR